MNDEIKEILEHLKEYLQSKIDNNEHKIFYNDLMWDVKTIDCINAIDDTLDYITNLQQDLANYVNVILHDRNVIDDYKSRLNKVLKYLEKHFQEKEEYENAELVRQLKESNIEWLENALGDEE